MSVLKPGAVEPVYLDLGWANRPTIPFEITYVLLNPIETYVLASLHNIYYVYVWKGA